MIRYIGRKHAILCMALICMGIFACIINEILIYTFALLIIWIIGTLYALNNIKNRFTWLSFNIGFFLFLMGGYIYHWIVEGNWNYFTNSNATILHTCRCLLISLCSYSLISIIIRNNEQEIDEVNNDDYESSNYKYVKLVIVCLLIISFMCELLVEIITTYITRSTSYALSQSISTGLPSIVTSLASYYYIALFLFWSLFPSKKEAILSFASLGIIEIIILLSGERGEPISMVLTLVFYIFMRQRRGYADIRIPRRWIVLIILIAPLIISSLQSLAYSRVNRDYNASVIESVEDFFETQGGSVKIIANGYDNYDEITQIGGHTYVTGTIRSYFKNNIFTRLILGKEKKNRTVEDALSGDSYLATYGYTHSAYTYSKGVGSGSTYIAEVYQDGGIIFLIVFNIFLAYLMRWIDTKRTNSIIVSTIVLNIFRYMVLLPRGVALQWFTSTFAIQNLILFAILFILNKKNAASLTEY